jgi:hypothetical protein
MQLGCFVDREREGLRDGKLVVIVERRVLWGVEQLDRRRREPARVIGDGDREAFAISGGLFVASGRPPSASESASASARSEAGLVRAIR